MPKVLVLGSKLEMNHGVKLQSSGKQHTKRKRDTCNNLQDFFNNWPILRDDRADTLVYTLIYYSILLYKYLFLQINIDFDFLYPNSGLLQISGWNNFLNKIKECGSKSADCNVLLNCLEQSTDESSRPFMYFFIKQRNCYVHSNNNFVPEGPQKKRCYSNNSPTNLING